MAGRSHESGIGGGPCALFWIILFALLPSCGNDPEHPHSPLAFENVHWMESGISPILAPGMQGVWNELKADTGDSLILRNGRWWLFHSGQDIFVVNLIGLHISAGLSLEGPWIDFHDNPILAQGNPGEWYEKGVAHPSVLERDGLILMYYSGFNLAGEQIGLATSADGVSFARSSANPVITVGSLGEWDSAGVDHPSVIYDGTQYVMAYRGWASEAGFTDIHSQIGIATSVDGLVWTKNQANPVLRFGPLGTWDEHGLLAPRLWYEEDKYFMNYSGKSVLANLASSIGHATAKSPDQWTKSPKNPIVNAGNTRWTELEWGTNVKLGDTWFMLTTAWVEGGSVVLWSGAYR